MERKVMLKNKFFLTNAISFMIKNGTRVRAIDGIEIITPSFVHLSAEIKNSVIGQYSSIGANCKISNSKIEESIV